MIDQTPLDRAAKRLAEIEKKIEDQRARIPRLPPGIRTHAEQVLASYESTRALFLAHYQSLGGKRDR